MSDIWKKCIIEIIRIVLTACLAVVGLETTGCVASGNGATAAFSTSNNSDK